ncbi:cellulose-binding domain-containing protein [Lentzea sp. NBC_00516]|uniref:cellulose-binding domain-containing protein n=1 Tax=Lentzea sp. NBC_00516 TaxID=2903582 RepID=UPI002E80363A|nr:cellulose-binding domain-containing protein [Lentzea sp. NBC_00516]WUD28606.1 cellulose-binding domain-containing protein [Lentzea sp. NBC_00516]
MLLTSAATACGGEGEQASPAPSSTPAWVPSIIEPPTKATRATTVQSVVDVRTVRLWDGTEIKVAGLAAPDTCWTEASTAFAKTMLLEKPVEPTPEGSLRLADGTDYAMLAVELGMVRGDAADDRALTEAEQSAAAKQLGRWGPPCVQSNTAAPPPAAAPPPPASTGTAVPPAPKAVTGCSVEYRVTHTWPGGFRTDVTIRNTGTTDITGGWTLRWKFANGQKVSEMWNATMQQSGADVSATAVSYNQTIAQGGSVLMGFTASSDNTNSDPRAFSLNGFGCTRV